MIARTAWSTSSATSRFIARSASNEAPKSGLRVSSRKGMKSPPSRAHQTMLAFDRISNNAGGNPPGGRALKQFLDFLFESLGCRRRREASRYPAFSIDKEFRKIPFDRPDSLGFALEKPVK